MKKIAKIIDKIKQKLSFVYKSRISQLKPNLIWVSSYKKYKIFDSDLGYFSCFKYSCKSSY